MSDQSFQLDRSAETTGEYLRQRWVAIRSGDLGSVPIIIGLVAIIVIFGSLNSTFLSAGNFVNLMLQISGTATIAIGIVYILLIAEIDLSVAFNSAVGAVVMTLLLRPGDPGWPWFAAVPVGLAVSTLLSVLMGVVVTRASVPSFVVTLAGNLALSGVVLLLTTQFSTAGTITISDKVVVGIANSFLPDIWGWVLLAGAVAVAVYLESRRFQNRRARGLSVKPASVIITQLGALSAIGAFAVYYANTNRGVPTVTLILGAFLVFWSFVATKTRFGRHVYAVGGNPEAARRAGINVARVRLAVFAIAGFMAGAGGIIFASRLRSVATNTGGGNLLLNVIAAAVIGGTSLFGGRGKVSSALLGALVITSVDNGMDGLGLNSGIKFVITGLVLLGAVLVDALSSRKSRASGR